MKATLHNAMKVALKARDKTKLDTVRILLSSIQYEEMEKKVDALSDEQALQLLQRELKKRKEELEFAVQAKREDLVSKLKTEIAIVEEFLPKQLSANEITEFFNKLKTENPAINLSVGMKAIRESFPGMFDGKVASEIAKRVFGA